MLFLLALAESNEKNAEKLVATLTEVDSVSSDPLFGFPESKLCRPVRFPSPILSFFTTPSSLAQRQMATVQAEDELF